MITNIGCVSQVVEKTISVSAKPQVDFLPATVRCLDKPFSITDQSLPGSNSTFSILTTWQWEYDGISDPQTTTSTNPTKTYIAKTSTIQIIRKLINGLFGFKF